MIMPGLGGIRYYEEHLRETARVLGLIKPKFLTFMGINPPKDSAYAIRMQREQENGENRPLTGKEMVDQMIGIIKQMPPFDVKIGCFPEDIDQVGNNPLTFTAHITPHENMFFYYGETKGDLTHILQNRANELFSNEEINPNEGNLGNI
jgi:hypothetical protein